MKTLDEVNDFYEQVIKYENSVKKWINTPSNSKAIENEIQNSRTELQRCYPKLEKKISYYGGYKPTTEPIKIDVFDIAFDSINKSNINGKLNAINEVKNILNRAIGKLKAEGESWYVTEGKTPRPHVKISSAKKRGSVHKKVWLWAKANKLWSIIIVGIPVLAALVYIVDYFWKLFS